VLNLKKKKFKGVAAVEEKPARLVKTAAMSREGDMAIIGDSNGQVDMWNLLSGQLMETMIETSAAEPGPAVCNVALSNSHLFSVIAFNNNTVSVYDNEMGDIAAVFTEHQSPVKHLCILEDGRKILTSDGFNSCKIWVAHSGQLLESITVACNLLGISPDIKYVVSGAGENM
jgi:WD40 repeat protein